MDTHHETKTEPCSQLRIGDHRFDPATGEVWAPRETAPWRLRPRSAKLLTHLAQQPGTLKSRVELQELLWGDSEVDAEQGLNACVRDIRRRLGDQASNPTVLETLPGRGYRLIARVTAVDQRGEPLEPPRSLRPWVMGIAAVLFLVVMVLGGGYWAQNREATSVDAEARALLREADYLAKSGDLEALQRSIQLMEQALEREPDWALARAELARVSFLVGDPERARTLGAEALQLAPDLAEAHALEGFFAFYDHLDWDRAFEHLEHAITLDPDSTAARHALAHVLSAQGEHEQAVAQMLVAVDLDPVDARLRGDAGWLFYFARRFPEAVDHSRKALELAPGDRPARVCLLNALVAVGDLDTAALEIEETVRRTGWPEAFRKTLAELPAAERVRSYWRYLGENPEGLLEAPSRQRLIAFGQLGQHDAARRELAELVQRSTEADLLFVHQDPLLDPIREIVASASTEPGGGLGVGSGV